MTAPFAWRSTDSWLVAALVVPTVGLCWRPSWWVGGALLLALTTVILRWRRLSQEHRSVLEENDRLHSRIHEFANLQGRFVGNIAHEINTPLAVVLAEVDLLLLRSEDPPAVRSIANSMAAEVRHLSDLVASFLRLAHPLVHEDRASHVSVYVGDIVIAAAARCRELSKKLDVTLVTVLCEPDNGDPSAEMSGDPVLLEAMVENLLRNAIRFSPPGAKVELVTRADADSVALVVRDHGVGIASAQQESVFDWFFEGPEGPSKTLGTGFGLAIAKRVAEHHGGTITLRDTTGGGCEFDVTLPRWSTDQASSAIIGRQSEPPVAPRA